MSLFDLFTRSHTAAIARERLQLTISHARAEIDRSRLIDTLRDEVVAIIAKHVMVDRDKVQLKVARHEGIQTLDLAIELPAGLDRRKSASP
jgi:cell division topological specificity factor